MESTEKRPRRWLGGKVFISTYIVIAIIIFIAGSCLIWFYLESVHFRKNYDFEHPVIAKYFEVQKAIIDSSKFMYQYFLYYEYTSPEGIYYCGPYEVYKSRSEAESHLGEEVLIYIDGKGGSTPFASYGNKNTWALILSIIAFLLGIAIVAVLIIPHRWKPPKPPKPKKLPSRGVHPL